jgi:hypothetical protein
VGGRRRRNCGWLKSADLQMKGLFNLRNISPCDLLLVTDPDAFEHHMRQGCCIFIAGVPTCVVALYSKCLEAVWPQLLFVSTILHFPHHARPELMPHRYSSAFEVQGVLQMAVLCRSLLIVDPSSVLRGILLLCLKDHGVWHLGECIPGSQLHPP